MQLSSLSSFSDSTFIHFEYSVDSFLNSPRESSDASDSTIESWVEASENPEHQFEVLSIEESNIEEVETIKIDPLEGEVRSDRNRTSRRGGENPFTS